MSSRPEPSKAQGRWIRRAVLAALPLPLLAGCSSNRLSAQNYGRMLLAGSFDPFASAPRITREQAAAVSYASIGVTVGSGPQTMLVLATSSGQTRLWTSAARIALETANGRIVRTGGLSHNLAGTMFAGTDPLAAGLLDIGGGYRFARTLDFADIGEFGIPVSSTISASYPQEIEILGATIRTVHVREECTSPRLDWSFTNEYWADANNGMIWQSVQTVHPDADPLTIQTLRPAQT